jgi:hypothetical protein
MIQVNAVIALGASQSNVIDVQNANSLALLIPAAWTAAAITFLGAEKSNGTFLPIYDDSENEISVAVDKINVSTAISLAAISEELRPFRYIKLRSGVAATPVVQEAARTIYVVGKE